MLAALGLAGPVFALIEQPDHGWGSPARSSCPLRRSASPCSALRLSTSAASPDPMLAARPLPAPNFSAGNAETLGMYGGLSILFFLLAVFLQEVAGWSAVEAGVATLPVTVVMFLFSRAVRARWPTASGRGCSWASGRSWPPSGSCCCCASTPTSPTSSTCSRRSCSSRSACP